MNRWIPYALAGALILLLGGLVAYRQAVGPGGPQPPAAASADDESVRVDNAIKERSEAKRRVVGELIAGRLSLLQAAAAFRDLNAQGPPTVFPVRDAFPAAASEDEAYCLSVESYVRVEAPRDQAADLTRRLNDELDARRRDGTLQLPGP